jgi:hypothetical protein
MDDDHNDRPARQQESADRLLRRWIDLLQDDATQQTLLEIIGSLDLDDPDVRLRLESDAYQSLLKKACHNLAGGESEVKRRYVRNTLSRAAASRSSSDDLVSLYIDWIGIYSEVHFRIIGAIASGAGSTRAQIWRSIGKSPVREGAAEAVFYNLLFRELSSRRIIRRHRQTDSFGNVPASPLELHRIGRQALAPALDTDEGYELTPLGEDFLRYATTDPGPAGPLAPRAAVDPAP